MTRRHENMRSPLRRARAPARARVAQGDPAGPEAEGGGVAVGAGDAGGPRLLAQPRGGARAEGGGGAADREHLAAAEDAAPRMPAQGQGAVAEGQDAALADRNPRGAGGEVAAQPALVVGEEGTGMGDRDARAAGSASGPGRRWRRGGPSAGPGRCVAAGPRSPGRRCGSPRASALRPWRARRG